LGKIHANFNKSRPNFGKRNGNLGNNTAGYASLGVASTLRRAKSKRPRLQNKSRKAGALLLTRRSVDATPSEGCHSALNAVIAGLTRNPPLHEGILTFVRMTVHEEIAGLRFAPPAMTGFIPMEKETE
jgi:hypothetical protein